jgi:hypothetical protein
MTRIVTFAYRYRRLSRRKAIRWSDEVTTEDRSANPDDRKPARIVTVRKLRGEPVSMDVTEPADQEATAVHFRAVITSLLCK